MCGGARRPVDQDHDDQEADEGEDEEYLESSAWFKIMKKAT
jgi:hypothetical protein